MKIERPENQYIVIPVDILEKLFIEENPSELIAAYCVVLYRNTTTPNFLPIEIKGADHSLKKLVSMGLIERAEG